MKYELKDLKPTLKEITIELTPEEAKKYYNQVVTEVCKVAEIKGFRKGKVPRDVVIERFEGDIKSEVAEKIMKDHYVAILEKENINAINHPGVSKVEVTDTSAVIVAFVEVISDITLGNYKGLEIEKRVYTFKEEDLEKAMAELKEKAGKVKEIPETEAAKMGDVVFIDFEGFVDGVAFDGGKAANYELKLGTHTFIDTFEDQIVGHVKGDKFDVNVSFPENYKPDLAGKKALFKVTVNTIKRVETPELDDELAKELGFETLEELKNSKKEEIEAREKSAIEEEFADAVLNKVKNDTVLEVPEILIRRETEHRLKQIEEDLKYRGMTLENYMKMTKSNIDNLVAEMRPSVIDKIKMELIIGKISEIEKIEVSQEDIDERIGEIAAYYGTDVSTLTAEFRKNNRYDMFIENITLEKIAQKTIKMIVSETIAK